MGSDKKVCFGDLSLGLKVAVIFVYITGLLYVFGFFIGFIIGITELLV